MCSIFDGSQSNRPFIQVNEIMKLTMSLIKGILLIQHSNEKTNIRKIKSILHLENRHRRLKIAFFDIPKSKGLKRYQIIPQGYSLV